MKLGLLFLACSASALLSATTVTPTLPGRGSTNALTVTNLVSSTNAATPGAFTNILWGRTIWVDSVNGNNATARFGDLAKPALTISQAMHLATAGAGDTVWVRNGTYDQGSNQLTLKKGVHLIGQSKYGVIIKGSMDGGIGTLVCPADNAEVANLTINSRGNPNWTRISLGVIAGALGQTFTNFLCRNVMLESDTDTYTLNWLTAACDATLIDVDHNRPGQTGWDGIRQSGHPGHATRFYGNRVYMDHLGATNALNDLPGVLGFAHAARITDGYYLFQDCELVSTNGDQACKAVMLEDGGATSTCRVDIVSCLLTAAGTANVARIAVNNPTNCFVRLQGTPGNVTTATLSAGLYRSTTADEVVIIPNGAARTNDLPDTRWVWEGWSQTVVDGGGTASGTNIVVRTWRGSGQLIEVLPNSGPTTTNIVNDGSRVKFTVRGTNWVASPSP